MANSSDMMIPPQGGVIKEIVARLKLIFRLMGDRRISPWLKLIPLGMLAYLVSPADASALGGIVGMFPGISALDDTAIIWLGSYLFFEFCPPDVVREHVKALGGINTSSNSNHDDVVDAETIDIKDDPQ